MSKLLYSATMSLDGFIAGAGGDMSWLSAYVGGSSPASEPDSGLDVEELMADIGALLIGHRTFTGDDPNKGTDSEGAFGGKWQGPWSCSPTSPRRTASTTTSRSPPTWPPPSTSPKEAAGGRYVNVLGANVAEQCLQAGLLDEILVIVAPVLLGDGTRLFEHPGGTNVALERIGAKDASILWYRVSR